MKQTLTILSKLLKILLRPVSVLADFSLRLLRLIPGYRKLHLLAQKATAVVLSILILFSSISSIFLYSPLFKHRADAAWFNDNWSYRKAITVTVTSTASDILNLQTLLTIDTDDFITAGKLQSDCDDLRFTNTNGDILPYYYDSGCNGNSTKVWIQADKVPANTTTYTVYMYYGNPSVNSASDSAAFYSVRGLVGYWAMNESLWNTTSGEVKDVSVNANNGTAVGNATTTASGQYSYAGTFDGSGDYVNLGNPSSLNFPSGYTIAAWIRPTSAFTNYQNVFAKGDATALQYGIIIPSTGIWSGQQITGGDITGGQLTLDTWSFVVVTHDGATMRT